MLERALELTAEYARSRGQFGRPIGAFQAVAQRLADAYIDVEAVRLTMWQAAWRLASRPARETEIATAKFWAADAGHRVAHTAVHVHGGVGIDTELPAAPLLHGRQAGRVRAGRGHRPAAPDRRGPGQRGLTGPETRGPGRRGAFSYVPFDRPHES